VAAGPSAEDAVLAEHVDHRPVGPWGERQAGEHVEQLVDGKNGRQTFRHRSKKRERVALFHQRALSRRFGALPLADLDAKPLVDHLERGRPLSHTAIELGVCAPQGVFLCAQGLLRGDTFRDVDGVAKHVRP
jgi:hypothetical protein